MGVIALHSKRIILPKREDMLRYEFELDPQHSYAPYINRIWLPYGGPKGSLFDVANDKLYRSGNATFANNADIGRGSADIPYGVYVPGTTGILQFTISSTLADNSANWGTAVDAVQHSGTGSWGILQGTRKCYMLRMNTTRYGMDGAGSGADDFNNGHLVNPDTLGDKNSYLYFDTSTDFARGYVNGTYLGYTGTGKSWSDNSYARITWDHATNNVPQTVYGWMFISGALNTDNLSKGVAKWPIRRKVQRTIFLPLAVATSPSPRTNLQGPLFGPLGGPIQ